MPILSFKAVRPKKTSSLIAEQILRLVESGVLAPGHRLPPERKLAKQFDINRQAVREALSALQLLGVVATRPGSGTVIAAKIPRSVDLFSEIRHLDNQDNPFEVMEARAIIEPEIVRRAALRATPSQLRRLAAVIDHHEAQVRAGQRSSSGDLEIHIALAQISGNHVLVRFIESVAESADQWLWRNRRERQWDQTRALSYLQHHRQIYAAIKIRDARTAVRIMRSHLRATYEMLKGSSDSQALQSVRSHTARRSR